MNEFGWMRKTLFEIDDQNHKVWGKWLHLIGKNNFVEGDIYPDVDVATTVNQDVYKLLSKCYEGIAKEGYSSSDLIEWMGYAIGIAWCSDKPRISERAQRHLEQSFPWEQLIKYPADYLSSFLAENGQSGVLDYYPTPSSLTTLINKLVNPTVSLTDSVIEPCLGGGGMVLPSQSLNITGMDLNVLMVKAACIQAFFYKPQMLYVPEPILGIHVHPIEQRVHKYFEFDIDSRIYCGNSLLGEFQAPRHIFEQHSVFVDVFVMPRRQRKREVYKYKNEMQKEWQSLSKKVRFEIVKAMAREHEFDVIMTNPPFNSKMSKYDREVFEEIAKDNALFLSEMETKPLPQPQLTQLSLF
ncbi:hypothetical protein [Viridibacillus arvi]|uniref:hypothetical protein n=1 Tax=Viridibacillus arvi TaxID=263475 RepID=UPI0034CF3FD9